MSKKVIIIGASGHGKVVADIIQKSGETVLGFLDDNSARKDGFIGLPILGTIDQYRRYIGDARFIIAIGNAAIRERLAMELHDVSWYTAIHPAAVIAGIDVDIGEGTAIMANAVVNSGAKIGRHCIINSSAVIEHDNMIEDYVHISVGTKLAGTVKIGKSSWVGIGASVSNNINVCANCMIGAGSVVIRDISEAGTYVGVPAKRVI